MLNTKVQTFLINLNWRKLNDVANCHGLTYGGAYRVYSILNFVSYEILKTKYELGWHKNVGSQIIEVFLESAKYEINL